MLHVAQDFVSRNRYALAGWALLALGLVHTFSNASPTSPVEFSVKAKGEAVAAHPAYDSYGTYASYDIDLLPPPAPPTAMVVGRDAGSADTGTGNTSHTKSDGSTDRLPYGVADGLDDSCTDGNSHVESGRRTARLPYGGTDDLAAHEIAFQIWSVLALSLDAVAIAAQAMIGHALGAVALLAESDPAESTRLLVAWLDGDTPGEGTSWSTNDVVAVRLIHLAAFHAWINTEAELARRTSCPSLAHLARRPRACTTRSGTTSGAMTTARASPSATRKASRLSHASSSARFTSA